MEGSDDPSLPTLGTSWIYASLVKAIGKTRNQSVLGLEAKT